MREPREARGGRLTGAVALIVLAGCGKSPGVDPKATHGLFDEIVIDTPPGLSGLALDDHDILWAVPERDRKLVEITLSPTNGVTIALHPIDGVPDGVDTEGLAWLGGKRSLRKRRFIGCPSGLSNGRSNRLGRTPPARAIAHAPQA